MRTLLVALAALLASPALAEECRYVSPVLGSITFLADPEMRYEHADGTVEGCHWMRTDEGTGTRVACDSGLEGFMSLAGDTPDATDRTLMTFQDEIWYRQCS